MIPGYSFLKRKCQSLTASELERVPTAPSTVLQLLFELFVSCAIAVQNVRGKNVSFTKQSFLLFYKENNTTKKITQNGS